MERLRYTSSRLYRVDMRPLARGFFPASAEPKWVVGVRTYCREELPRDPFKFEDQLPQAGKCFGFVTLIDAFTAEPIVRGLPGNPINMFYINAVTKSVEPAANGTIMPLVRPLAMPRRCNVAGSWVYNVSPTNPLAMYVELFFDDTLDRK